MRKIFVAIGVIGLGYGVYSYYLQQAEILQKLRYRIIGGRILNASLSNLSLQLDLEVTNDSNLGITMTNYMFDVYINGKKVGVISNASINQILNKNGGKSFFPLRINVDTTSLLNLDVLGDLSNGIKNLKLTLDGRFGVKKGLFRFNRIPFKETFRVGDYI